MQLQLFAVGKIKGGPEAELCAHYLKQIRWDIAVHELPDAPQNLAREARMLREAEAMRKKLPEGALLVTLDARGTLLSSEAFAKKIEGWQARKHVVFALGGQDGLHPELVQQSTLSISFSPMIWPHKLARAMLCEQLFRAQCILGNHPYHNGH